MRAITPTLVLMMGLGACAAPGAAPLYGAGSDSGRLSSVPGARIQGGALAGTNQVGNSSGSLRGGAGAIPVSATVGPRVAAPSAAQADAFARDFLNSIQPRSFAMHVELCGYFYVDAAGRIAATPPAPGELASCSQPAPFPAAFASYHTHGAFDYAYDNEVPSIGDLEGDFSFGIDGYVSTPGGRVWRIEFDDRRALQVCGLGCVAIDPGFVPRDEGLVRASYSIPELAQR